MSIRGFGTLKRYLKARKNNTPYNANYNISKYYKEEKEMSEKKESKKLEEAKKAVDQAVEETKGKVENAEKKHPKLFGAIKKGMKAVGLIVLIAVVSLVAPEAAARLRKQNNNEEVTEAADNEG